MTRLVLPALLCSLLGPVTAGAQVLSGVEASRQWTIERTGEHRWTLTGAVEIDGDGWQLFSDEVELHTDRDTLVARGNVVFTSQDSRIAAEWAEFDTQTRHGTFHTASGTVTLGDDRVDRSMFGTQEPDAYFYGERLEKIGERTYRITRGGFTTCVQPTPRWEITASSVVVRLDEYAVLRNSLLRVKGVPVFYMPIFYYPVQEDDRATGFLLPTYGASTFRGQMVSNAFFWAINRSHDATFFHDWFSKAGQGRGAEYRYVTAPRSEGWFRAYQLNEKQITTTEPQGVERVLPARRSHELRGAASQSFAGGIRSRARVDYFSDVTVQQLYNNNIFEASRRQRSVTVNTTRSWDTYAVSGTFDRNETFFGSDSSAVHGAGPRLNLSRSERPLPGLPAYVSLNAEYAALLRTNRSATSVVDRGLTRTDITPAIRVPFARWPFLTINSSVAWRGTWWSQSLDEDRQQVSTAVSRRFFDFQSRITGPVFQRVWLTPNSRYADRFKHVIEPAVTLQRLTAIDVFDRIVQLEGTDAIVGEMTRISYGLTNRLYAKVRQNGDPGPAQETLTVGISQSYYTDARAAQFDRQFQSSFQGTPPNNFSPIVLTARVSPTQTLNGSLRAEWDSRHKALRTIGASGGIAVSNWLNARGGWSQRRLIPGLPGFDNPNRLDHYINGESSMQTPGNRVGGAYSFNYDILRQSLLQQRLLAYYNAQCCGFAVEYQSWDLSRVGGAAPVTQDRRFNFSFTLAGIGSFSNFFGVFGGQER